MLAIRRPSGRRRDFGAKAARAFDATFSAPKSGSVVWALSSDASVRAEERRIPFIKPRAPDPLRPGRGRRMGGRRPTSPCCLTSRYRCSSVAGPLLGRAFDPDHRLNPPGGSWQDDATQDFRITVEQVWALADAVEPRYRVLVLMAAFTGLRRGELFGLSRSRLDLLHRTVTVSEQRQQLRDGSLIVGPPKTDAGRRTVALPGPLIPEIVTHLDTYSLASPDALVFTGEKGGPLRDAVWQSKWAKARTAVGLPHLISTT